MSTKPSSLLPSLPIRFKPLMRALLIAAVAAAGTLLVAGNHPEVAAAIAGVFAGLYVHRLSADTSRHFPEKKSGQEEPGRVQANPLPAKQTAEIRTCSHVELKCLLGAVDSAREDEQKRLAREMHDDLGQLLAAMKMDLSTLARQLPSDNSHALRQLEGIDELVNSMLTSVRRIIADLPPKLLDDRGLFDALRLLASNFEKRYGVSCYLHLPDHEPPFSEKVASTLYRIAQESLNNTAKHACATRVDITIKTDSALLVLSIADNGRGARQAELNKNLSFGLIGMRERVSALDGELRVDTAPGAGMAVHVELPAHKPVLPARFPIPVSKATSGT